MKETLPNDWPVLFQNISHEISKIDSETGSDEKTLKTHKNQIYWLVLDFLLLQRPLLGQLLIILIMPLDGNDQISSNISFLILVNIVCLYKRMSLQMGNIH